MMIYKKITFYFNANCLKYNKYLYIYYSELKLHERHTDSCCPVECIQDGVSLTCVLVY